MSNKNKQQPYIVKPTGLEAGSVPPRYQPPPQPGILKHVPQQQAPVPSTSHQTNLHTKDAKHPPYIHKISPEGVKTSQSLDPSKYYPPPSTFVAASGQNSVLQYPPQHPGPIPNQLGIPTQHRQHRIQPEEDPRAHDHQRQRNFEEDVRGQHGLPGTRTHRPLEELNRGILNPKTQEELTQAANLGHRPHETPEFQRTHIPLHRTQRFTDEELLRLPPVEMLKFVRKTESESARIATEQHRHMQSLINEIRVLKEANQRLADDNQELRDLCCFLDDDRQKGRKLAREWQRFGRYTASVMRQEVSAYQNKLRELDNKQQELIKDNLELKELCLYLDEERGGSSVCPSCGSATSGGMRDDGDGSSSSTNADEPAVSTEFNDGVNAAPRRSASRERLLHESLARQRSTFNDQTMQYVRSLEQRVKQLEEEKRALQTKLSELTDGEPNVINNVDSSNAVLTGRPEAVVRALQVLEVREQLEREGRMSERGEQRAPDRGENNVNGSVPSDMDDGEKALVREMCNVVWRKLEEAPVARR